ncbi:hypothetical protein AOB57_000960 [Methanosarcina flavescens]|uniref:Uncharacterized protein n=1 Tax=Methanosarcina flavescens TaxID=1715806 RepID=A0A660HNW1_9EURY|nr:hypothetical protein AOB57_000960 [Methanosarcina flavescens]
MLPILQYKGDCWSTSPQSYPKMGTVAKKQKVVIPIIEVSNVLLKEFIRLLTQFLYISIFLLLKFRYPFRYPFIFDGVD